MNQPPNQRLIIVPTYNEAENIPKLLPELLKIHSSYDILVVDDSSPDGTGGIVQEMMKSNPRIQLLTRLKKDGLAGAYIAGFQWGLAKHYDSFLQMDADFSHSPKDVLRMFEGLEHSDQVIGSRYIKGGGTTGWTWPRKLISRGGNVYAQTILGLPYQDLTGGFNASKRKVLESIKLDTIRSQGYAFQVEIKYRSHRRGFKITEIPILFENRIYGYSKMSKDIIREAALRVIQMRNSVFA